MDRLERAKMVVKGNFDNARCGIFNTRNLIGDMTETLYEDAEITIDICRPWMYFEVFGLSEEEFAELEKFYAELEKSYSPNDKDKDIEDKLVELEEAIEIRACDKPYTVEEKYDLCVKIKRILDAVFID